jgi:UDP-N-acetylmuramoylalanine--D-glutamate ligase
MSDLANKFVAVIGLGARGQAACEFLCHRGARVIGVDAADTPGLRAAAAGLGAIGAEVLLGASSLPKGEFELAVISPAVALSSPLVQDAVARNVPVLSELELGYQQAKCLGVAIGGTNGKGTTAELVERVLANNHRRAVVCGHRARPICSVVDQTKEIDFLVLQVNALQLEATQFFRPAVAVLLNLAPDLVERFSGPAEYARACSKLFAQQQTFDWAVVQSEALARLKGFELAVPAKTITFSATDASADLHLDRGLLISRLENWAGPLLDMDHCQLRGPHNAENLMAALAVGHVLRLPLDTMVDPLKTYSAGPHRCELVAELNGVQFINDSKATNVDALHKALLSVRAGQQGEANIWLIAGGKDQGSDFHYVGPVLSQRVKRAFLIGQASEKISSAWGLFTPCTVCNSLVEAITEAAAKAVSGDVVLFSPACSSLDQFRSYQERGEIFCLTVKSIGRGASAGTHHMHGKNVSS